EALGRGLAGRDLADDAAQQEGAGLPRRELLGCEAPAALVLHEGERDDLARAGANIAGLQVVEPDELPAVDRLLQRLEGRIAQPQPRRIAEDRFVGGDPERAELHERATRLGAQRALAPRHRGEAEQGELLGVEAHVVGQVVGALRDAVAQVVVVARLAERLDRLERDAQLADVVLVAFELPLEVGVVAAGHIALRVAAHAREDFRLGESRLGRHEREHETEQPILDGNRRGDGTRVRGAPYFAAGVRTPSTSMTYTTASPVSSSGITTSSCEPTGAPTRASTTASGNAWASPRLRVRATGDDDHEEERCDTLEVSALQFQTACCTTISSPSASVSPEPSLIVALRSSLGIARPDGVVRPTVPSGAVTTTGMPSWGSWFTPSALPR